MAGMDPSNQEVTDGRWTVGGWASEVDWWTMAAGRWTDGQIANRIASRMDKGTSAQMDTWT